MNRFTPHLIRWSGLVGLLAGVLYAAGAWLHPLGESVDAVLNPRWIPSHIVYWIAVLLLQFALIGLYAFQAEKAGKLGLVGFVLAFIGTSIVSSILIYVSAVAPLIASEAQPIFERAMTMPGYLQFLFVAGFGLGYVLFGLATVRAAVYPRWSGLLLIIGVTLFIVAEATPLAEGVAHALITVGDTLFGLGLAAMGYALWSKKGDLVRYGQSAVAGKTG